MKTIDVEDDVIECLAAIKSGLEKASPEQYGNLSVSEVIRVGVRGTMTMINGEVMSMKATGELVTAAFCFGLEHKSGVKVVDISRTADEFRILFSDGGQSKFSGADLLLPERLLKIAKGQYEGVH